MAEGEESPLEFRLLGPVQVLDDEGQAIPLGGAKQRATLAILLLRRNVAVPRDQLIDGLWGTAPPPTAGPTVKTYVSRLRSALASDGGDIRLATQGSAYRLRVEKGELDLERFETLSDSGRSALAAGDVDTARDSFARALALWEGTPLQDLSFAPFAQAEIGRLDEMRLATLELRLEADLAAEHHAEVIGELESLVAQYPFREGFWGQLMLALYRSDRQGEALIAFDRAMRILADELGVDPGQQLQALHRRILEQDPVLELVAADARAVRVGISTHIAAHGDESNPAVTASNAVASSERDRARIRSAGRKRADRPRRRVGFTAGATAVVVALALVALILTRADRESSVTATYDPGTALLDLASGRLIGTIAPGDLSVAAYPIFAGGKFWVNDWSPNAYVEIDPGVGAITKKISLPPRDPDVTQDFGTITPWAVDDDSLWVTAGDDLVRMDIALKREEARVPLDDLGRGSGLAEGVAVGGGSVWVSRDVGRGQILRLTPDGRVERVWNNIVPYVNLAFADGALWAADDQGLARIDSRTEIVTRVGGIHGNCAGGGGGCVAAGGGFGWTSDASRGLVYKVSENGQIAATYPAGVGASFLSYADGILWVANTDSGAVTGIDAVTGNTTSGFTFGHPVWTMVAGGGVLLVDLGSGLAPVEGSIEGLTGSVARLFAYAGELGDEEPALNTRLGAYQIEFATCAKLLNYSDAAPPDGAQLRPEVAAEMPIISSDGRTYTFRVRPGYRFSPPSNETVTAETFRYSIERALSPQLANGPTVPEPPGPRYVDDIVGERAYLDGTAEHISGLRANADALTITLKRPSGDFLERLALPYFCPVPTGTPFVAGAPHQIGAHGEQFIVSAGPYYVADYSNGGYVILRRNPNYVGPRNASFDAIAIREGADVSHALDRIQNAGWDGITSVPDAALDPGGPIDQRWGSGGSANPSDQMYFLTPEPATRFIAFNSIHGIFADRSVRKAAALALGRDHLAAAWGAIPTDQVLSQAFPGYVDRHLYPTSGSAARARNLMRGRTGHAIMAVPSHCAPCAQSARIVQLDLRDIGIDVEIREVDDVGAASLPNSRFDLVDLRADLPYPDAASFIGQVVTQIPAAWVSPAVSAQIESLSALNGRERIVRAASLEARLERQEVPFASYGTPQIPQFVGPGIACRVFTPVGYGLDLATMCPGPE